MRISPRYIAAALLLAFALTGSVAVAGGGNKEGTAAADQLLVPVGARGIALGSAYTAGLTGIEAIYYNPAGLSGSRHGVEVMFAQMNGLDNEDGISYFGIGSNMAGFGHVAFSVKALSFGDILITDERQVDGTGAVYSPTVLTLGLTYSRALTDRIRSGVTVNMVSEELDRVSATGFAFDVGVQYSGLAGFDGLELGVTLRHIGSNMKYEGPGLLRMVDEIGADRTGQLLKIESAGFQLPTSLEIGMAYKYNISDIHNLLVMTSFENNNFISDQYRVAVEYMFNNFLALRGSYNIAGNAKTDYDDATGYLYGPAFGVGLQQWTGDVKLYLDYAYRTREVFGGQHVIALKVGF
ncbi:MAG: PorV/PorQ family protein [Bacteroidetes bacterium]|nr:PorV/PorQ family protein [Bacteroidota bacterium]